ncbi:tetratricopeptide repeat protein [Trichocoleus desertorum AS-A10]|uniref:protein kinase domain-containing protein n=1 Tax=Trichocoleus desertorum TaxID=1481672 RepID=UPI003296CBFB
MGLNLLRLLQSPNPDKPLGGRYKVLSKLGAGGFGQTFLAEDMHLPDHPCCVVKQLKPQVTDASSLQTARRLFDTEAKVLYQLGSHDQIPRLMAHFEEDQEFYLVQEFIDGASLSEELIAGQPWPEARVLALLQDILHALAFVHEQHVIHRDIKPPNLMRRRQDGKIVLIDFGAVKQVSTQIVTAKSGHTNLTISIGTQGYMPNEQLGGNPRFSSDLYAVGMIGIQALTGVHPRHLSEDVKTGEIQWRDRATHATPELADLLDRMVRYDFRARYATASDALAALQALPAELLAAIAVSAPSPNPSAENTADVDTDLDTVAIPDQSTPPTVTAPTLAVSGPPANQPVHAASNPLPSTTALPETQPSPSARSSVPTAVLPSGTQSQSVKPKAILAVLVAIAATFLVAKALFTAKPATQTASTSATTAQPDSSPSANPTPAATPVPSAPATAPQAAAPTPAAAPIPTAPSAAPAQPPIAPLLAQADGLRSANQPEKALALYDQAIAQDPTNAAAQWGRCYSLNRLQRPGEAITACDKALASNPKSPEALWSKGYALDQLKRHSEAIALYDQAIALKPNFAEAWSNKGSALLLLDRPDEAVAAYDQATTLKPDLAEAWNNRGVALWSLRRFDEAVTSIDKAIQIKPDYPDAIQVRQKMRQKLGR